MNCSPLKNKATLLIALWFCVGLLWVLPNHGGSGLALPQNLFAWSLLAVITLWSMLIAKNGKALYPTGTSWIVCGAVLWSLPILWSPVAAWQWNALPKVLALWGLICVWLLLLKSSCGFRLKNAWLMILVIAALIQVVYGAIQLSDLPNLPGGRPYGSFQQVNVMASFLATGMLCAFWLFTRNRQKQMMMLSAIALILLPAMLVLLQSRSGYLGAFFGSVIFLSVSGKKSRSGGALLLMVVGTMAGLGLLHFGPTFFPDFIPGLVEKEGSTLQRWYIIRLTWQLIMNHPIVGNGYGSFEVLFGQLAQHFPPGLQISTIQYPHNEFLYTWMEGGIVAVLGVFAMLTGIIKRLWSKGGRRWAGIALLLPLALHMNLEYPLYQSVTHGITLIMLLLIAGPAARTSQSVTYSRTTHKWSRAGVGVLASAVLVFMISGAVTEVQLTRIEQQGLMPLVSDENATVKALVNPLSQYERLDFDRHVALILRFNTTRNDVLLIQYQNWAEGYLQVHNNPDVYNSLIMIYRSLKLPLAQGVCLRAKGMWPEDKRFSCL